MTPDTSPDPCPDLLSTPEAAAHLGVSERHFRRRYAKVLASVQGDHGAYFYRRSDLDGVRGPSGRPGAELDRGSDTDALTVPGHDLSVTALVASHARELASKDRIIALQTDLIAEMRRELDRQAAELAALRAVPKRRWWRWWS